MRQKLSLTGTARYASINAHKGYEQSRRDDLEAIAHMLMYVLRGALPWSGLDAKTKEEKYRKICAKKETVDLNDLCAGYPDVFQNFLKYARNLEFTERPDYDNIQKQFSDTRSSMPSIKDDWNFQWLTEKPQKYVELEPRGKLKQPDDKEEVKVVKAKQKRPFFSCCGKMAVED